MSLKFTKKYQFSKHCKDGKDRNFVSYYINDVLIMKQKIPFDRQYEAGFDRTTLICNEYIINNRLYQTRFKYEGCGTELTGGREVKFPLSKKIMEQFDIEKDEIIKL